MPSRITPESLLRVDDTPAGRAFYRIADLTVEVQSDLPIADTTFSDKFRKFRVPGPGPDTIMIRHRFGIPELAAVDLGAEVYNRQPWIVSQAGDAWYYQMAVCDDSGNGVFDLIATDRTCRRTVNFHHDCKRYRDGNWHSLFLLPSDQFLLSRALAGRHACYVHSAGVILSGHGLLFVGHSSAGKSTMVKMLADRVEILCDDRNIVRLHPDGFRIHGTWSHGEIPFVSSASAPLRAIFFLNKSTRNGVRPLTDPRQAFQRLLPCLIQPIVTGDWFRLSVTLLARAAAAVPCYDLDFDKSGAVVPLLEELLG